MAANLTPQYLKAEAAYRRANGLDEELACLQVMLRELPKHKGTDHLQAELRHKISKAKQELEAQAKSAKKGFGVRIPRQGAGRVVIVGPPNGGKSQLLAALTRATPEIADYPFTTREPLVGMMSWEDIFIQLIDTPPITPDVLETYMQGLIRGADLVLLLADMGTDEGGEQCAATRERLHQTKTHLGRSSYLDSQDLGRSVTQTLLVLNKFDLPDAGLRQELWQETLNWDLPCCSISALTGWGLEPLRSQIFRALDIVRVYTKQPLRKEPDYERPFTLRRGGTVADVAALVHQDFAERLKFARVWGAGVRPGTVVKGDHLLQDQDVVELHV